MHNEHLIRREIFFVALRAAKGVTDLVLGAQVANKSDLALEDLEAHLTDELQTYTNRTYKHRHDVSDRIICMYMYIPVDERVDVQHVDVSTCTSLMTRRGFPLNVNMKRNGCV